MTLSPQPRCRPPQSDPHQQSPITIQRSRFRSVGAQMLEDGRTAHGLHVHVGRWKSEPFMSLSNLLLASFVMLSASDQQATATGLLSTSSWLLTR